MYKLLSFKSSKQIFLRVVETNIKLSFLRFHYNLKCLKTLGWFLRILRGGSAFYAGVAHFTQVGKTKAEEAKAKTRDKPKAERSKSQTQRKPKKHAKNTSQTQRQTQSQKHKPNPERG